MNIERMTTEVRPRNRWEAIDLGFTMARQWFLPLWGLWLLTALPVMIAATLVLPNNPGWASFVFWLFKPLYEQALLYYLSRSLFGEYVSFQHIRIHLWRIIKSQLWQALSYRRLSFARSFNQPVAMLENLHGSKRAQRLNTLHFNQRNVPQWLTIVAVHLEAVLYMSIFSLFIVLIPEEVEWFDWEAFLDGESLPLSYLSNLAYFFAASVMAPFFVGGGFALYLTRRTELEAWDIELSFKKIRNRLQQRRVIPTLLLPALLGGYLLSAPDPSYALTKEEAKETIEAVMQGDEFGRMETYTAWEPIIQDEEAEEAPSWLKRLLEWLDSLFDGSEPTGEALKSLAGLFKMLLWIAAGLLIVYLLWRFTHWLNWLGLPQFKQSNRRRAPPPTELFGLAVNADTLPDDVMSEVRALLEQQQWRAGIALLYRASLIHLIHIHQLDIPSSATEGECQRLVHSERPRDESHFFQRLTQQWLLVAYAHETPSAQELDTLCDEWPSLYSQYAKADS